MTEVKKIPDGYHSLTPALIVNDGLKAIEYYKKVFGAKQRACMMMPDGKKVAHAELEIGDSLIMLGDEFFRDEVPFADYNWWKSSFFGFVCWGRG